MIKISKKINPKILKITIFRQNICIRQEAGFCCITYNVCSDTGSYTIENNADADSVIGTSCSSDFIEIPGELN